MTSSILTFFLSILFLDYISTNSVISMNESRVGPFTGGYEYYENLGYYKLYSLPSAWRYAWRQCREDGAHLVVIDSDDEYHVVMDMVEQSNTDAFIGVHDLFFEGYFFTVTDKPLVPSNYNKWRKYEPENNEQKDCVLMARNGEMWVQRCEEKFNFICEFEFNKAQL